MRMAKALIAAVTLAVVLVAAVVVPMALTPGVYGFDEWPTAKPQTPVTQVVNVDVPRTRVVRVERSAPRAVAPSRQLVVTAPRATAPAPTAVAQSQQNTQQQVAAQPESQEQPQAAHEAPMPTPVIDARDHHVQVPHAVAGEVE